MIFAFSIVGFIVNSEITSGGVNGIGILIYYASGKLIEVGYTSFAINAILLIFAWKIVGKKFAINTLYGVIVIAFFINFAQKIVTEPFLADDMTMSAICGGIVNGFCLGMILKLGGSTGGTDILAMIINKYRNISPGKVILYADIAVIGSSFFVFHFFMDKTVLESFRILIYGFVIMGVNSYVIDLVLLGAQQSVQIFIFSKHHEQIAEYISKELGRGVTVLNGEGWYTKSRTNVLLVIVYKKEMHSVLKAIKQLDPEAFTSIGTVTGVYGKGFSQIKK
ncbi:membrane protein [Bacteroidia bacterium]|nr:membrane protein [Bacteroidia bacterium]